MIPLLYAQLKDVQAAVDETTNFLVASVKAFEETKQRLQKPEQGRNIEETPDLNDFIQGCQFYCSGNLNWA